jgi:hypothetical protein
MDDDGVKMNGHTLEVSFFKTHCYFQRQICVFAAAFENRIRNRRPYQVRSCCCCSTGRFAATAGVDGLVSKAVVQTIYLKA